MFDNVVRKWTLWISNPHFQKKEMETGYVVGISGLSKW